MPERHDEENLTPADRELEAALKSLAPAAALGLDAIGAAFAAGQRSHRREIFAWRCATTTTLLVAMAFYVTGRQSLIQQVSPQPSQNPVVAYRAPAPAPQQQSVLILNEAVRERGIDGLPAPRLPSAQLNSTDLF